MLKIFSIKNTVIAMVLMLLTTFVNAHEVWLEHDGDGLVRVYLGYPIAPAPDSGEKLDKLSAIQVFSDSREVLASLSQKNDHWLATVSGTGDVRLFSDQVWQPWAIDDTADDIAWWQFWKTEPLRGAILEARAGRTETTAKLNFELVPVVANGIIFTAMFQGKPLVGKQINILTPGKKQQQLSTDAAGQFEITALSEGKQQEKGRYILSSNHTIDTDVMHSGKQVVSLIYITSLSFVSE